MHVMPSDFYEREHTMTQRKSRAAGASLKALMAEDQDFLCQVVREAMQQILEAEMRFGPRPDTQGLQSGAVSRLAAGGSFGSLIRRSSSA